MKFRFRFSKLVKLVKLLRLRKSPDFLTDSILKSVLSYSVRLTEFAQK